MSNKISDFTLPHLLDYEGREGSPPIGKITLPVHAFASINHKDFGGLPYPLEGEQLIEFWVVPHGETAIIGQNVLFENNFFYDLSRNMLDNNCTARSTASSTTSSSASAPRKRARPRRRRTTFPLATRATTTDGSDNVSTFGSRVARARKGKRCVVSRVFDALRQCSATSPRLKPRAL